MKNKLFEEKGPYQYEPWCEEAADSIENGNVQGDLYYGYSYGPILINGEDASTFFKSNEVKELILRDISYPVKDGHASYSGLDELVGTYSSLNFSDPDVQADLIKLGFDKDDIKSLANHQGDEVEEIETWIDYDIQIDDSNVENEEDDEIEDGEFYNDNYIASDVEESFEFGKNPVCKDKRIGSDNPSEDGAEAVSEGIDKSKYLTKEQLITEINKGNLPEQYVAQPIGQGEGYKIDFDIWNNKFDENIVVYIPEFGYDEDGMPKEDSIYSFKDFLDICKGNRDYALQLLEDVDWQYPETLYDEYGWDEEELDEAVNITEAFSGEKGIETIVPFFSGFYNTMFEEYWNSKEEVGKIFTNVINKKIAEILPSFKYEFQHIQSPKYYNYGTDEIYANAIFNTTELFEFLNQNLDEFEKYCKANFSSYDGFISFLPDNAKEFMEKIKTVSGRYESSFVFGAIEFALEKSFGENIRYDLNEEAYYDCSDQLEPDEYEYEDDEVEESFSFRKNSVCKDKRIGADDPTDDGSDSEVVSESLGKVLVNVFSPKVGGWHSMLVKSVEEAKRWVKDLELDLSEDYFEIHTGDNTTDVDELVAWGGKGGFWANVVSGQFDDFAFNKNKSEREKARDKKIRQAALKKEVKNGTLDEGCKDKFVGSEDGEAVSEAKNGQFVGRKDIPITDEQEQRIRELFDTACEKFNLTYKLEKRPEGDIYVYIPLDYNGLYRRSDTKALINVKGKMVCWIHNSQGFTQDGSAGDSSFDWDKFNKHKDNEEYWTDQQFTLQTWVNMLTKGYRQRQWYGSSIETYDYDDNLAEIGIEKAISRAIDILSKSKKVKGNKQMNESISNITELENGSEIKLKDGRIVNIIGKAFGSGGVQCGYKVYDEELGIYDDDDPEEIMFDDIESVNSLNESFKDYLPRGGFMRDEEGNKQGAFFGQGTDEQLRKAKIIARVKFAQGDRFGRVTKEDLDNFEDYKEAYDEMFGSDELDEGWKDNLKKAAGVAAVAGGLMAGNAHASNKPMDFNDGAQEDGQFTAYYQDDESPITDLYKQHNIEFDDEMYDGGSNQTSSIDDLNDFAKSEGYKFLGNHKYKGKDGKIYDESELRQIMLYGEIIEESLYESQDPTENTEEPAKKSDGDSKGQDISKCPINDTEVKIDDIEVRDNAWEELDLTGIMSKIEKADNEAMLSGNTAENTNVSLRTSTAKSTTAEMKPSENKKQEKSKEPEIDKTDQKDRILNAEKTKAEIHEGFEFKFNEEALKEADNKGDVITFVFYGSDGFSKVAEVTNKSSGHFTADEIKKVFLNENPRIWFNNADAKYWFMDFSFEKDGKMYWISSDNIEDDKYELSIYDGNDYGNDDDNKKLNEAKKDSAYKLVKKTPKFDIYQDFEGYFMKVGKDGKVIDQGFLSVEDAMNDGRKAIQINKKLTEDGYLSSFTHYIEFKNIKVKPETLKISNKSSGDEYPFVIELDKFNTSVNIEDSDENWNYNTEIAIDGGKLSGYIIFDGISKKDIKDYLMNKLYDNRFFEDEIIISCDYSIDYTEDFDIDIEIGANEDWNDKVCWVNCKNLTIVSNDINNALQEAISSQNEPEELDEEEMLDEGKARLDSLHKLMNKCWYDGDGQYAKIGNWEMGLGGYDLGYEFYYAGRAIFAIDRYNVIEFYQDSEDTKKITGYTNKQIFDALKEYNDLSNLKLDIETYNYYGEKEGFTEKDVEKVYESSRLKELASKMVLREADESSVAKVKINSVEFKYKEGAQDDKNWVDGKTYSFEEFQKLVYEYDYAFQAQADNGGYDKLWYTADITVDYNGKQEHIGYDGRLDLGDGKYGLDSVSVAFMVKQGVAHDLGIDPNQVEILNPEVPYDSKAFVAKYGTHEENLDKFLADKASEIKTPKYSKDSDNITPEEIEVGDYFADNDSNGFYRVVRRSKASVWLEKVKSKVIRVPYKNNRGELEYSNDAYPTTEPDNEDRWSWFDTSKPFRLGGHGHYVSASQGRHSLWFWGGKEIAESFAKKGKALMENEEVLPEADQQFENPFKEGDILFSSWGYSMRLVDFYKVISSSKSFVKLAHLQDYNSKQDEWGQAGYKMPKLDQVEPDSNVDGRRFKVHIRDDGKPFVKINNYEWAEMWDGKPKAFDTYD